jgi:hypothetical protein
MDPNILNMQFLQTLLFKYWYPVQLPVASTLGLSVVRDLVEWPSCRKHRVKLQLCS